MLLLLWVDRCSRCAPGVGAVRSEGGDGYESVTWIDFTVHELLDAEAARLWGVAGVLGAALGSAPARVLLLPLWALFQSQDLGGGATEADGDRQSGSIRSPGCSVLLHRSDFRTSRTFRRCFRGRTHGSPTRVGRPGSTWLHAFVSVWGSAVSPTVERAVPCRLFAPRVASLAAPGDNLGRARGARCEHGHAQCG